MRVLVIPALADNYIYLIVDDRGAAVVVDPGEATPILSALSASAYQLQAILITHRHADHVGGLAAVRAAHPVAAVYAPVGCHIEGATPLRAGETLALLTDKALRLQVLFTPGHTREHVAYVGDGFLFCGDTLFAGGCGRLLDGSAQQMHDSLALLSALPEATAVYCGHEYTQANLRFALAVEPANAALQARATTVAEYRSRQEATVPSSLAEEKATNPFLRLDEAAVINAASTWAGKTLSDALAVFTALRQWKDSFR